MTRNRVCCIPSSHRLGWWSCATSFHCTLWLLTPRCFLASAAVQWNLLHSVTIIMIFTMMITATRRKRCISELWELLLILRTSFIYLSLATSILGYSRYQLLARFFIIICVRCVLIFIFSLSSRGRGFRGAAPEPKHAKHFGVMLIHTRGRIRIKRRRRSEIRGFFICLSVWRSKGGGRKWRV